MAQTTVYQRNSDFIFDRLETYMVLDVVTYTIGAEGEITNESSSKTAIKGILQDLTEEDYPKMSAGNIPQSDKRVYVRRDYTLHAGMYDSSGSTKQDFIYFPTSKNSTTVTSADKYEITTIETQATKADFSPDETATGANRIYTLAYLKKLLS
jgi:hypothetical protein